MEVPFLDLRLGNELVGDEIDESIKAVVTQAAFSSGPFVQKFEEEFAEFCGAKHCVAVNSGTSALHLALLAHGIQHGDEVITVPNTFIATAWAITYCGAKPVFVDVDPKTWLINPDLIEQAITQNSKAILPVHLYGQAADIDHINKIAEKHGLAVIEDAAQSHSGIYNGKKIGGLGNTTCFSFYPGKNLGAYGEGGAVVTDDENIANYIRILRDHGQTSKYHHEIVGFNYRMDGIQGAVLSIKLKHIQDWTDKRNEVAKKYTHRLSGINGVQVPHVSDNKISAFHLYVIGSSNRENLMKYLNEQGIGTGLHYPIPIHLQKAYQKLGYSRGDYPIAELNSERCISLPMFPELTDDQIDYVCKHVSHYFGS